jgi:hypothetical protein
MKKLTMSAAALVFVFQALAFANPNESASIKETGQTIQTQTQKMTPNGKLAAEKVAHRKNHRLAKHSASSDKSESKPKN